MEGGDGVEGWAAGEETAGWGGEAEDEAGVGGEGIEEGVGAV